MIDVLSNELLLATIAIIFASWLTLVVCVAILVQIENSIGRRFL